jgi:hypothetical protein
VVLLLFRLAAGNHDLGGVGDHDVVSQVEPRRVVGLVLAAQDLGDP